MKYLDRLIAEAGIVELCHIGDGRLDASWHSDADRLRRDAFARMGAGNLYVTINRLDREVVDDYRRTNPGGRTRDEHVVRYCRLFFDLDPVRPKDASSTDAELEAAKVRAKALLERLYAGGWPTPARGLSGNGCHLQYRTALPNSDETKEQLRCIYRGLGSEFSDDVVSFDVSVRNPARLCGLYGTIKRKGKDIPGRPHRRSKIWIPPDWSQVSRRQVDVLANLYSRHTQKSPADELERPPRHRQGVGKGVGRGDFSSLDIVRLFQSHEHYRFHIDGSRHSVWCPWRHEHSTDHGRTGAVVYEADGGWPGFFCHHAHCSGRDIRDVLGIWTDAGDFCTQQWEGA